MLPVYKPGPKLEQTLRSVLDQDPGPDQMQIAVVDDCPGNDIAERIVSRLAPGRVEIYRQPSNVGLARNWNSCIARSRGHWVHILHQDDYILPGFYERLEAAGRHRPEAGMAFCNCSVVDGEGNHVAFAGLGDRTEPGIVEDWIDRIVRVIPLRCPAVVVRRETYERLGGFRTDLCYIVDWEMWARIACSFAVHYEPQVLACYRSHAVNETSRLRASGRTLEDVRRGIEMVREYAPPRLRRVVGKYHLRVERSRILEEARRLEVQGSYADASALINKVCRYCPRSIFTRTILSYFARSAARRAFQSLGQAT